MGKFKIRKFFQKLLFLFNYHRKSDKPNVLIFSIPRSGSTWLQELIWTQPKFKYANEPLNLKDKFLQKRSKINGFEELYSPKSKNKVINYFKNFIEGNIHVLDPSPIRKNSRFFTSRIVFKVIHGGELFINDIAEYTNSKIVYLIRNPIAVSLSRKQLPRTKELTSEYILSKFNESEKETILSIMDKGDRMEKRILMWCIQNRLALSQKTEKWLVLSYEELTCFPERVIKELAKHCDLTEIDLMLKSVNKPSAVTTQSEKNTVDLMRKSDDKRYDLISRWRKKVSESEAKKYFEICDKMNISYYNYNNDLVKFID
jgi:hypothetical protein